VRLCRASCVFLRDENITAETCNLSDKDQQLPIVTCAPGAKSDIYEQATSPSLWDTGAMHSHSTVFAGWRQCGPHLIHDSFGPIQLTIPFGSWICSAVLHERFLVLPIRYTAPPHPPKKLPLTMRGFCTPSNNTFLLPTRPITPNGSSIASAVFPQCTLVTNGQNVDVTQTLRIGRLRYLLQSNAA